MNRRSPIHAPIAALLILLLPFTALGNASEPEERKGTLALVNIGSSGGWESVRQASEAFGAMIGGWARQPGIAAYLWWRPSPGALPVGDTGRDLVRLVEQVRSSSTPSTSDLGELGRLLGVDYLLLLKVKTRTVSARLFSVLRQQYAPRGFEAPAANLDQIKAYVMDQTRHKQEKSKLVTRWWIWAIAAGVAALTLGLALGTQSDDGSGDLRIRVNK